jgi:acetoin utilization protein AcuC
MRHDAGVTGSQRNAPDSSGPGSSGPGSGTVTVVWDPALLAYDLGEHPLDPVRVELTMALAAELGILDRDSVSIVAPIAATDELLLRVHTAEYLDAVRAAPKDPYWTGFGLNTGDNPVFDGMHEASALVAGGTVMAAEAVWSGRARRAVNIAGGLHHAMSDHASGFCVYNDVAIGIQHLLDLGARRVAYVDIDVHHGDGVQAAFWNDPRVLTISLHESPITLFPGTGFPSEVGGPDAVGTAVNVALPAGTSDAGWLRAFHAVVPGLVASFEPDVLVTQCGCDTHAADPLADLRLSVDGQRAAYLGLRELAERYANGRWLATGGGGYGLVNVVPRAWTHLLGVLTGEPIDPRTAVPASWRATASHRRPRLTPPTAMTDGVDPLWTPWQPGAELGPLDRAIRDSRHAVFPLHGLDPDDPRD